MSTAEKLEIPFDDAEYDDSAFGNDTVEATSEGLWEVVQNDIDLDEAAPEIDPVRAYLQQISKTALLKAEEEVELAKRIEAGQFAKALLQIREEKERGKTDAQATTQAKLEAIAANSKMPEHLKKLSPEEQLARLSALALKREVVGGRDEYKLSSRDLRTLELDGDKARDHLLRANLRLVVSIAKRYRSSKLDLLERIQEGNNGLIRAVEKFDYTKGFKFSTYADWWIRQAITRANADLGRTVRLPVHVVDQMNKLDRCKRELLAELDHTPTHEELAKETGLAVEKVIELEKHARDPISLNQRVGDGGKENYEVGELVVDSADNQVTEHAVYADMQTRLRQVLATLSDREALIIRLRYGLEDGQPRTLDEIGAVIGVSRERVRQVEHKTMKKLRHPARADYLRSFVEE